MDVVRFEFVSFMNLIRPNFYPTFPPLFAGRFPAITVAATATEAATATVTATAAAATAGTLLAPNKAENCKGNFPIKSLIYLDKEMRSYEL